MARSEAEILKTYTTRPKKRVKVVLQACALYLATFVFFYVTSKVINSLVALATRLRARFTKKDKDA